MNCPSPNGRLPEQPGHRHQNALPGSGAILFTIPCDPGPCDGVVRLEDLTYDPAEQALDCLSAPFEFDAVLGLNHVSARHFDPSSGSWITADVLGPPPEPR